MWGRFVRRGKRFRSFLQGHMKVKKGAETAARFATTPPPLPTSASSLHVTCVGVCVCICQRESPKMALTLTTLYRPSPTPVHRRPARWREERFFSALERPKYPTVIDADI